MRVSGRNLNKKDEHAPHPPDHFYGQPDNFYPHDHQPGEPIYQQPIIVRKSYTGVIIAAVIFSVVSTIGAVALISAIAIPNLLESRNAANEARAVSELRTFHSAQATYYAAVGDGTYASFDDLKEANLITADKQFWTRPDNSYTYTLTRSIPAGDRYCIIADSLKSKRAFAIGSEGVIYYSDTKDVTCANGELGGSGLKPLQ